ncbi:MAG: FHA domain-containing protein [Planctomycetota bacterium]|jgi:pSer/pThr/pTyr-binding forkhead associated (FHA) protein
MNIKLVLLKKNGEHKSFELAGGVNILGRRRDCDLRIPLKSISRRHCQINLDNGTIKVRDLNSTNGTLVNGEAVNESVIKAGDKIKLGPLSFVLQVDGVPNDFASSSVPTKEISAENESQEELSEILDDVINKEDISEVNEEESEELDFLLNDD